jgi:hypothetical protein
MLWHQVRVLTVKCLNKNHHVLLLVFALKAHSKLVRPAFAHRLDAPWGTVDNPVQVTSAFSERIVGVPDPDDDSLVSLAQTCRSLTSFLGPTPCDILHQYACGGKAAWLNPLPVL